MPAWPPWTRARPTIAAPLLLLHFMFGTARRALHSLTHSPPHRPPLPARHPRPHSVSEYMPRHGHGPRAELELLLLVAAAGQGQGWAWPMASRGQAAAWLPAATGRSPAESSAMWWAMSSSLHKKKKAGTSCWNMKQLRVPDAKPRLICALDGGLIRRKFRVPDAKSFFFIFCFCRFLV